MKISPDWFRFCYLRLLLMVVVWLSWPFRPLDNPKGFLSLDGDVFSGIVTQDRFDFSIFEILGFLSPAIPTSDLLGSTSRYAQNGEFAATFNVEDYRAACEKCYKQIEVAIARYREIKDKINEGLKFYEATTSVKQQCSDFVMTRSIQCRDMIEDVQKQMSGLSILDGKNSSTYNYSSTRPPQQPSSQSEPPTNQPHPQTPYYHPTATTLL
ncbi:putative ALIX V-shaped domain-containing protein [Helianthus annuus]|uniref:ALIX V-shaped domain-containing protein n=1 Tax=Helianthus annuus TaxID=4232 RepID=A0A9K3JN20_HELAN|nr:putative ALIX V-shaped domain-containing protein [Helianthus annuus]